MFGRSKTSRSNADLAEKIRANLLSIEEENNLGVLLDQRQRQADALAEVSTTKISPYWTQAAMSERAADAVHVAETQLSSAISELSSLIETHELDTLRQAQEAWEKYKEAQAEFAALQFCGGSVEPLVRNSERETVILQRLATVRAAIEERKKLL